jgi:hypothetical protein
MFRQGICVKRRRFYPSNNDTSNTRDRNGNDLSHHILPNSATMVGACMVVISIVKGLHPGWAGYLIDKLLAVDSVLFLISALISFYSIRSATSSARLERWAEVIFLFALGSMTIITVIFSFEFA